ncbi:pyridoxal phosphate-dependent decarboxylase family protein [Streptomyces huiliensis]|uniref:pyridoxal phosphate-dependent decarboxylase family protein n=1 Tax=Streptomyces huiliensis TaxID=2876027 RepID=UPI001CC0AE86|nr:aminotransferase class V-fold PLP-dependent enzyme [Streptomyces huiliensis]MBZ4322450.1 aminotransferase class V-fold PLP-dependent enzyme [Streptomyces huiliensis]
MELKRWLEHGVEAFEEWTRSYEEYETHPATEVAEEARAEAFAELTGRLRGSYPFFHPCYAGQMLKPPHPVAVAGYLAAMLVNPNNHALDGGPATSVMEEEAVARLAAMAGLEPFLGHLTSNGTLANLEALFVARESSPGRSVAIGADAHYTHARMCHLLGMRTHTVPVDGRGRTDVAALERLLASGDVGTIVATTGTTALGAVDPVHRIVPLARRYGARVHVDAAYGGFFTLLAGDPLLDDATAEALRAVGRSDSVVIDPHKHGLQPYGCGAVLFADPEVARFYRHDSPYTYFTSGRPHLGEISLECSRSGAAAAALWLTLRLMPLTREGLGGVLAAGRRAALRWAGLLDGSPHLEPYQRPELDIVTYYPRTEPAALSRIGAASREVMRRGMEARENPVFLSVARIDADAFARRRPHVARDAEDTHVLRSVLMKPESEPYLDRLHRRVMDLARPTP